ncbi:MAG: SPOR domain-containing protein [Magnetococcales bacterium]|nr:SPOR domain-containing protein [Magnetococcales bacterium]
MSAIANLKTTIGSVNLTSLPGISALGSLTSKIHLPAALQPIVSGVGPVVLVVVLLVLNIIIFFSDSSIDEEMVVTDGHLMTNKLYALPDPATAKIVSTTGVRIAPTKENIPKQLVSPSVGEVSAPQTDNIQPPAQKSVANNRAKYIVQIGQFINDSGVNDLVKIMQDKGYNPKVHVLQQKSFLNNVQAGPYRTMEKARESEIKLRASGWNVNVESSDDGFIISLGKSAKLAPALTSIEKFDLMGISPLRIVKVAKFKPVKSVYVGPYNSRAKAEEVGGRMKGVGLNIPQVQEWVEED